VLLVFGIHLKSVLKFSEFLRFMAIKPVNQKTIAETISGHVLWQWRQRSLQQACAQSAEGESAVSSKVLNQELDWLLREVTGLGYSALRLETYKEHSEIPLSRSLDELTQLWQQRYQHRVPLQYLLGIVPWRDLELIVSPAVLIPRPETEEIIDLAQQAIANFPTTDAPQLWADLGTGSGAIAIALALALPTAEIHAVDLSPSALSIAQQNVERVGVSDRVFLHQGSWLTPLNSLPGKFTGILANPPYIPTAQISQLETEVAAYEPHLALDGGADGLDCLREIIATAPNYLQSGGVLLLEMMIGQAATVRQLLQQQGSYQNVQIHADLCGIERFALAHRL
jgi:release factor glutamine methyltransferase